MRIWFFGRPTKKARAVRRPPPAVPANLAAYYTYYMFGWATHPPQQALTRGWSPAEYELFREYLTPVQQQSYRDSGWIPVRGSADGAYFVSCDGCVRNDIGRQF